MNNAKKCIESDNKLTEIMAGAGTHSAVEDCWEGRIFANQEAYCSQLLIPDALVLIR